MESVKQIVEQLEEAKAFIKRDTSSCYRIAMILIDNCVELMLMAEAEKLISSHSMHSRMNERLRKLYSEDEIQKRGISLDALSQKRIKQIRHSFPEKVEYLYESAVLPKNQAECLKELHNYRNNTYHLNVQNYETLYAVTLLYLKVATLCLTRYRPEYISSEGYETEKYFLRYGIDRYMDLAFEGMKVIAESLSSDVILKPKYLFQLLGKSVDEYVRRIDEAADFLADGSTIKDINVHYKVASYYIEYGEFPDMTSSVFASYASTFNPGVKIIWKGIVKDWEEVSDIDAMYLRYVALEKEIAPIVSAFETLAADLDNSIQIQVDIARGK